jgi:hypothetical protein
VFSFDQDRWIPARDNFLFPVKALSIVFRKKFLDLLEKAFDQGKLHFPGKTAPLAYPRNFHVLVKRSRRKRWYVYAKKPFGSPQHLLNYLGRYLSAVARRQASTASLYPTIESYRSKMGRSPSLTGIEKMGAGSRP